jgi:uncharacterized iron-regulated protein
MKLTFKVLAITVPLLLTLMAGRGQGALNSEPVKPPRAELWVDAVRGEPVVLEDLLEDLQHSQVIYVGEYHSLPRHHQLQRELLQELAQRGTKLLLAMEQFEFFTQPSLDRFNAGKIDLDALVKETNLAKRWPGQTNYHGLLRAAQAAGIPVVALNARAQTIRAVAQRGLAGLAPEQRHELPESILTDDPPYERLLDRLLGVHMAFDPKKLRPVFEAQVARDETMAARLVDHLKIPAGLNRTALVICGRGHCEFLVWACRSG